MKAIILAAGIGRRLDQATAGKPKSLLSFNGLSLLERHINNLSESGIKQLYIVTGYQQQAITDAIAKIDANMEIHTVYNPDYTQGSLVSLYCAKDILAANTDIILMDADVLYDAKILQRLICSQHSNCLLLDEDFEAGDEPVKICVSNDRIVEFRKKIDNNLHWEIQGESVGFFRFNGVMATQLLQLIQQYINDGNVDEPHEEAIRDLILAQPEQFHYENISGLPWIEIDFPEDIEKAKTEVLRKLHEQ